MEREEYKKAGVDIDKLDQVRAFGREMSRATFQLGVEEIKGGVFGSRLKTVFEKLKIREPIVFGETDGIGNKEELCARFGFHKVAGLDIVTCNVSDILRRGGIPLFFLDGISYTDLDIEVTKEILLGISQACKESQMALIGGETAQKPNFLPSGRYHLYGAAVGVFDEERQLCPEKVEEGDVILGIESSGLHTNGYSLATKIIEDNGSDWDLKLKFLGKNLAEALCEPEENYTKAFLDLFSRNLDLHQAEHITGSGLTGRLEGIGGVDLTVKIDRKSWEPLPIFKLLQRWGEIDDEQMFATFNMGVGMVIALPKKEVAEARAVLKAHGHDSFLIGKVAKGRGDKVLYKVGKE